MPPLRVSPSHASFHRLVFALLTVCFALCGYQTLVAQSFTVGAETLNIATFSGRNATVLEIPLLSDDPAFTSASITVTNSSPGWLTTTFLTDKRSLRISCGYDQGLETSAQVTVRSATHTATLTAKRLCIAAYLTPKTLLSADRTKIFALYKDTVLLLDARTQNVLARAPLPLPPGFAFSYEFSRHLSLSENAAEIRVHLSGCPTLFRLSAADLSSLGHLTLPPAQASTAQRVFAGERDGRLYFVRYGARTNPEDGTYQRHYQSDIDVVSLASGALLQSYRLPAGDQLATVEDLALHPDRAELWVRERRRSYYFSSSVWLCRLALDTDGLVTGPAGDALRFETGEHSSYGNPEPWSDSVSRLLLRRDVPRAIVGNKVIDASAEPPALLPNLPFSVSLFARNELAASSTYFVRLDTREYFDASLFARGRSYYNPAIVGLSEDGRDLLFFDSLYDANLPAVAFLPAVLAAQQKSQARVPQNGQIIAPTDQLSWYALPGADRYRVFLSTDASALAAAQPEASLLVAEPPQASLTLSSVLAPGSVYHWRVDAIFGDRTVTGAVQTFSVSHAQVKNLPLAVATLAGARRRDFSLPVVTSSADTVWELVSDLPWLTVRSGSGVGPGTAELSVDALTLPVGNTSATLRLVTDAGTIPLSLTINAYALRSSQVTLRPGHPRVFAIGPTVTAAGVTERLLCTIDTESEQILRCVAVPSATLNISEGISPSCTSANAPLYIFQSGDRLGEFDPESLALNRIITLPNLSTWGTSASIVRPAEDGRLWVLHLNNTLTRLAASGTAYDLILPALNAHRSYLAENGTTIYTFTSSNSSSNYPESFTLRRYDLAGAELTLTAERTVPYTSIVYSNDVPSLGLHPTRLSYRGVIYDEALAPVSRFDDVWLSIPAGGSGQGALSSALLHLGEDYSEASILPTHFQSYTYKLYEPEGQKVLSIENSTLQFTALASLTAARAGTLESATTGDVTASLRWQEAPALGLWPSHQVNHRFEYRRAGSIDPWIDAHPFYYHLTTPPFTLSDLSPDTAYEVRTRSFSPRGSITPWSQPLQFSTVTARPAALPQTWPQDQSLTLGKNFALPVAITGEQLEWTAEGLPPGLTLNPTTGTIEGIPSEAGSYRVTITVRNPGGSLTHSFSFRVPVPGITNPVSAYTGMLDFSGGPIMGVWTARRNGSTLTGTYRTPLFTRSFKARFGEVSISSYPSLLHRRYATTRVTYQGVRIGLSFTWDLELDQVKLYVWTENAQNGFSAATTPETGLPSYWAKSTLPHPFAGRYTGLLIPGEHSETPAPDGAGFFTLDLATDGIAKVSGETALGQKFTQALPLSAQNNLPFFYYSGITLALGGLELSGVTEAHPRVMGEFVWARDSSRKSSSYRDGFEQQLLVIGAPLPPTGKTLPPLAPLANPDNAAAFALSGGGLDRLSKPIEQILTPAPLGFDAPKPGTPANPNRVTVKLTPKTGLVTGSAAILDANGKKTVRTQKFRGMFVKDPLGDGQDMIGGYFLLPDARGLLRSGLIEISEPELEPAPSPNP